MNDSWFLVLRAGHVLLAALWLGAAFMLTMYVLPAVREAGPAGGHFMQTLQRRKLHAFMALAAILTVVTGIWLYWRFTSGLEADVMLSPGGLAFGIGGLCGLLAMILGGAILGRGFARIVALVERAAAGPETERAAHLQAIEVLRQRLAVSGKLILLLMVLALVLMAIGHYI
ncbi:MAG TPA: hypothetical protein VFK29_02200 [Rhodanobacteraceae bacterium]|nr:hypothetical protein [Rhodanobacteraceae bacterium]